MSEEEYEKHLEEMEKEQTLEEANYRRDMRLLKKAKAKQTNQQTIFILVFGGIMGFVLLSVFSRNSKNNTFTTTEPYTLKSGEKVTKEYYSLNETIYCKNTQFSVTNIQEKTNKQDKGIDKGKKMIAITYKIKNTGENERTFLSSQFEVVSNDGEVIDSHWGVFTDMWKGDFFKDATLAPNGSKEGYLTYTLKEDDSNYYIKFDCNDKLFGGDTEIKVKP